MSRAEIPQRAAARRWKDGRRALIAGLSRVGWTRLLRSTKILGDDPKLVVHAAAQAQKAADFILGRGFKEKEEAGE